MVPWAMVAAPVLEVDVRAVHISGQWLDVVKELCSASLRDVCLDSARYHYVLYRLRLSSYNGTRIYY